jgi:transcription antitermination factor NusG
MRGKSNSPVKKVVKKKTPIKKPSSKKTVLKKVNKKAVAKVSSKRSIKKRTPIHNKRIEPQSLEYKYTGKDDKWIILQLSDDCSLKEHAESVIQQLKELCGEAVEFFLPMYVEYVKDKPVFLVLFDGYLFVKTNNIEESCFKDRTEHIEGPMLSNGKKQYVNNTEINGFKRELKKCLKDKVPKVGQMVTPKSGDYKNLEGVVLSVDKKNMLATVEFAQASRVVEVQIRIVNLDIMG